MYTEEEIAAELDKDEDFDYKKVLEMHRASPDAMGAVVSRRYDKAAERKAKAILYEDALVQQRLASQREKRDRPFLAEVPLSVDEDYWTSLMSAEPVGDGVS